ncbi:MAG: hypothetical protein M1825_005548 [Sarcosagium campestre]|nr:MAG: hypothetical protein M1825_005548 [Sarcosagium campestre]
MLKQLDIRSVWALIDWQAVADQLSITNGHAARMRYSRFKQAMEGITPTSRRRVANGGSGGIGNTNGNGSGVSRPKKLAKTSKHPKGCDSDVSVKRDDDEDDEGISLRHRTGIEPSFAGETRSPFGANLASPIRMIKTEPVQHQCTLQCHNCHTKPEPFKDIATGSPDHDLAGFNNMATPHGSFARLGAADSPRVSERGLLERDLGFAPSADFSSPTVVKIEQVEEPQQIVVKIEP